MYWHVLTTISNYKAIQGVWFDGILVWVEDDARVWQVWAHWGVAPPWRQMPKSCGRSVCEGVASSWLVLHWRDPLSIPKHLCDRATRRPEESLEDLLIKSRDQAEAWHFHRDGLFPYLFKRMAGQYFARYDQEIPRTSKVLRTSPWKLDRKVWKPHFGYAGGVGLCRRWRLWWGARDGDIERDREAIKSTHRPPTPCLILYCTYCTDMYWYYPILPSWTRPKPDEASRFGGLVCLAAWQVQVAFETFHRAVADPVEARPRCLSPSLTALGCKRRQPLACLPTLGVRVTWRRSKSASRERSSTCSPRDS